jgi:hypothetical protein
VNVEIAFSDPKAPETVKGQGEGEVEVSSEEMRSTQSHPPADSADQNEGKKRKYQEDTATSSTFKDVPQDCPTSLKAPPSLFSILDSDS